MGSSETGCSRTGCHSTLVSRRPISFPIPEHLVAPMSIVRSSQSAAYAVHSIDGVHETLSAPFALFIRARGHK